MIIRQTGQTEVKRRHVLLIFVYVYAVLEKHHA